MGVKMLLWGNPWEIQGKGKCERVNVRGVKPCISTESQNRKTEKSGLLNE